MPTEWHLNPYSRNDGTIVQRVDLTGVKRNCNSTVFRPFVVQQYDEMWAVTGTHRYLDYLTPPGVAPDTEHPTNLIAQEGGDNILLA